MIYAMIIVATSRCLFNKTHKLQTSKIFILPKMLQILLIFIMNAKIYLKIHEKKNQLLSVEKYFSATYFYLLSFQIPL